MRIIFTTGKSLLATFIITLSIGGSYDCYGQKLLPDTIFVDFVNDSLISVEGIGIQEVKDIRNEDPRFVRYETKNKFLFIPVDQEIYLKKPLPDELSSGIPKTGERNYQLIIDKFEVVKKSRRFSSSILLTADIEVYKYLKDTICFIGTYIYDHQYIPAGKKENVKESTENLLSQWHTEFKLDLLDLKSDFPENSDPSEQNYFTDPDIKSLYMNAQAGMFTGYNWWGLQGEVFFSRPETSRKSRYTAGILRYNNNEDYESYAVGKRSEHYYFRRSDRWLFDLDMNFLLGFCKWKDVETDDPTLYQIIDFELSSIQSITYNKSNKKGLLMKAGIVENLMYVIDKQPKLQVGIYAGLGYKF
ncbi:MAG: hypothetical protein JW894_12915 [Bacteroidales bacterium]|nr:hypothetical protein [Bacteroidales bacterium]